MNDTESAGVPFSDLDESTECPRCGESVKIAMIQEFLEVDGEIRVTELGYQCPSCGNGWVEEADSG